MVKKDRKYGRLDKEELLRIQSALVRSYKDSDYFRGVMDDGGIDYLYNPSDSRGNAIARCIDSISDIADCVVPYVRWRLGNIMMYSLDVARKLLIARCLTADSGYVENEVRLISLIKGLDYDEFLPKVVDSKYVWSDVCECEALGTIFSKLISFDNIDFLDVSVNTVTHISFSGSDVEWGFYNFKGMYRSNSYRLEDYGVEIKNTLSSLFNGVFVSDVYAIGCAHGRFEGKMVYRESDKGYIVTIF